MWKFAITYLVVLILLAVAWPLISGIVPAWMPGDTTFLFGNLRVHVLFGTAFFASTFVIFIMWMFQKA